MKGFSGFFKWKYVNPILFFILFFFLVYIVLWNLKAETFYADVKSVTKATNVTSGVGGIGRAAAAASPTNRAATNRPAVAVRPSPSQKSNTGR